MNISPNFESSSLSDSVHTEKGFNQRNVAVVIYGEYTETNQMFKFSVAGKPFVTSLLHAGWVKTSAKALQYQGSNLEQTETDR